MALLDCLPIDSPLARVDPRARVLAAFGFAAALALTSTAAPAAAGAAVSLGMCGLARIPWRALAPRLIGVNLFVLGLALTLGLSLPPDVVAHRIGILAMKANGIVLATTALVSTIDASAFGHALVHLRCPPRLAHLLLFTVRYMETLHAEAVRLRRAMRARAFRPRMTAHAYRSLAALVGILLVRSLDRSERVLAAMKCRGFRGEFFVLRHFHWRASDSAFSVVATAAIAGLVVWGNV